MTRAKCTLRQDCGTKPWISCLETSPPQQGTHVQTPHLHTSQKNLIPVLAGHFIQLSTPSSLSRNFYQVSRGWCKAGLVGLGSMSSPFLPWWVERFPIQRAHCALLVFNQTTSHLSRAKLDLALQGINGCTNEANFKGSTSLDTNWKPGLVARSFPRVSLGDRVEGLSAWPPQGALRAETRAIT